MLNTEAHPLPIFRERQTKPTDDAQQETDEDGQTHTRTQSHARKLSADERPAQRSEQSDTTQQEEDHPLTHDRAAVAQPAPQEPLSAL